MTRLHSHSIVGRRNRRQKGEVVGEEQVGRVEGGAGYGHIALPAALYPVLCWGVRCSLVSYAYGRLDLGRKSMALVKGYEIPL